MQILFLALEKAHRINHITTVARMADTPVKIHMLTFLGFNYVIVCVLYLVLNMKSPTVEP